VREEHGSDSFLEQLLNREIVNDTDLYQMMNNYFLCEQVHILPIYSRLESFQYSFLGRVNCMINLLLFFCEFSINGKSNRNVCAITVPFSSHVMKDHLSWLINLIVFNIMKCSTILAAGTYRVESRFTAASFIRMLKIKD
jgi:hypothetical protein